jgi:hypothetical protein
MRPLHVGDLDRPGPTSSLRASCSPALARGARRMDQLADPRPEAPVGRAGRAVTVLGRTPNERRWHGTDHAGFPLRAPSPGQQSGASSAGDVLKRCQLWSVATLSGGPRCRFCLEWAVLHMGSIEPFCCPKSREAAVGPDGARAIGLAGIARSLSMNRRSASEDQVGTCTAISDRIPRGARLLNPTGLRRVYSRHRPGEEWRVRRARPPTSDTGLSRCWSPAAVGGPLSPVRTSGGECRTTASGSP